MPRFRCLLALGACHPEYVLRQIKSNCANIFHGHFLFEWLETPSLWHIIAVEAGVHPSLEDNYLHCGGAHL
jgi:hypothetical protein